MSNPDAQLISLGVGKYYRKGGSGELSLDVGPFTKALEFATGKQAQIIGKPSKAYFEAALNVSFKLKCIAIYQIVFETIYKLNPENFYMRPSDDFLFDKIA